MTFSFVSLYSPCSFFLTVPTSASPGHYPRPLLLRPSSPWWHWWEPTRLREMSSSIRREHSRDAHVPSSCLTLLEDLCSAPSSFWREMVQLSLPILVSHQRHAHPWLHDFRSGPSIRVRGLFGVTMLPNAPFLRSQSRQLAAITASDLRFICMTARFLD